MSFKKYLFTLSALAIASVVSAKAYAEEVDPSCIQDLSKGAIVVLSGGGFDGMNPPEVRQHMEDYIDQVNQDSYVAKCSNRQGLASQLLPDQTTRHIHQGKWRQVCEVLSARESSPLIIVGHSYGGAAAVSLARCLKNANKKVDLLITADSVGTSDDLGPINEVPSNVIVNLNTFVRPDVLTFTVPFALGEANSLEAGSQTLMYNVGLKYNLPAAFAHRNAFYDLTGGDKNESGVYKKPQTLLELSLAVLAKADKQTMDNVLKNSLNLLSKSAGIPVDVEAQGVKWAFKSK